DCAKTRETTIESVQGFSLSPDGSHLLLYRNYRSIYRRSYTAEYYVYEINHNVLRPLSTNHTRQQVPVFSNDGLMVAFVADNNIYIKKLRYNTEVAVTTDGEYNKIINGHPDWVYEEEFKSTGSIVWSPDNTTLCYLKYNETQVPLYSLPLFDSYCSPNKKYALYPGEFTYKYPVAGEKNSIVTLHSYDVENRKTKNINFEDSRIEYIPRIEFIPNGQNLLVSTLNREQNRLEVYSVNPKSTVVKSILVEESKTWVLPETYENMTLTPNNFVILSNRSGYNHLYQYSYSGALQRQITSGNYDVTDYYGTDKLGNIYYQSTVTGPLNRVISKIEAKTNRTVNLSPEKGTASATFTPSLNYYTLRYSSTTVPPVFKLMQTAGNK
ncbi:MAG: DPP IV N-terminal domain-containing protein, partial [Muribaculaceae bacterium]|nr:DPP IV N-terminal domain-containing protein [Muribaculaceae bacterium]